jgi:hypothetical protein
MPKPKALTIDPSVQILFVLTLAVGFLVLVGFQAFYLLSIPGGSGIERGYIYANLIPTLVPIAFFVLGYLLSSKSPILQRSFKGMLICIILTALWGALGTVSVAIVKEAYDSWTNVIVQLATAVLLAGPLGYYLYVLRQRKHW